MRYFISELRVRNKILYSFGWLCLVFTIICMIMTQAYKDNIVLGINAWIKPFKFFSSVWIFCWTMGWYLHYLKTPSKTRNYSWMVVVIMTFELLVITWQAANGRLSHFNISTPLYSILFSAMGIAITILTFWTLIIGIRFLRRKDIDLPESYLWGIRIGIILFVVFSFEGGIMAARLGHTIGSPDGGPGIPVLNWSTAFGDLRVAHFFGIHSLQILPLVGYYLARNSKQIFLFSALYVIWLLVLLAEAMFKVPAIG
jgi:hypothetical protein